MAKIKGESIEVKVLTESGLDEFNQPEYTEEWTTVDKVLISEPSETDIQNALTVYGARIKYTLCLPKGDTHDWHDTEVRLPNRGLFHTVGDTIEYIEQNLPIALDWNRKVNVEQIKG